MCLSKPKVEANAYILKGSWQDQACKCADDKKTDVPLGAWLNRAAHLKGTVQQLSEVVVYCLRSTVTLKESV